MTTAVIVGIDPHRKVFTATALDERGRRVADEHFANTSVGHHAALRWARELGTIERIGIEGTGGLGRALAEYLISEHVEVRDIPHTRPRCGNEVDTKGKVTSSMHIGSLRKPRETMRSHTHSSNRVRLLQTQCTIKYHCGTTPERLYAKLEFN